MTALEDARRKGFGVRLIKPVPVPVPQPVEVNVTVENTGLADALKALETEPPAPAQIHVHTDLPPEIVAALEQSTKAVIAAAEKVPAKTKVISCDLEHEFVKGVPVIKSIKFNYE